MSSAPTLSGTAGTLIAVLDACLVTGFGSVTVNSLSVASNIATVTVTTGHGFAMLGNTGPVIQISGATPAGLNTEWRVASVESATVFTFACPGVADGPASGTITAKRAPAGWEKRYSGTNKAAYARLDPAATAMLLRVDDTPTQYPVLTMYESMTDVDTGNGSSGLQYNMKSTTVSTLARTWRVFADGRTVWFFNDTSAGWSLQGFGDLISYRAADPYRCFLRAGKAADTFIDTTYAYNMLSAGLCRLARALSSIPGAIDSYWYSHSKMVSNLGGIGQSYPALADNALHIWPIEAWDIGNNARGLLPGMYAPVHDEPGAVDGTVQTALNGHDFFIQLLAADTYGTVLDITGPWQ